MLQKPKNKTKTLSERVTELIVKPNGSGSSAESEDEATAPKVVDFDEEYDLPDARSTDIRKRNVKLLSEQSARYKGKIASRKEFEESDDDDDMDSDDEDDEESDNEALEAFSKQLKTTSKGPLKPADSSEADEDDGEHDEDDDDSDGDDDAQQNITAMNSEDDDDDEDDEHDDDDDGDDDDDDDVVETDNEESTDLIAESNRQAEIQKGMSVQNQLRIWERLLELRIHSQKFLTKANQLPAPAELQEQQKENAELRSIANESTESTARLLKSLLELQTTLTNQYSELRAALKSGSKRSSPFREGDGVPPIKRVSEHLNHNFTELRTYRNAVLLKWDDRTKLLTPGAGSKKKTLNEDFDIIRKIDNALMNRSVLVEKSQIPKNNHQQPAEAAEDDDDDDRTDLLNEISGDRSAPLRDVNVYDDSDFYHQQLRELIEYKANTSSNMTEVTKQFVELQKLRQKMKKKVDTRASKGRKIRYTVHNKLINFMAPDDASTWTVESKNELYKSLFAT